MSLSNPGWFSRCDGTPQCPGGEDELNCGSSCSRDQFSCANGQCIPIQYKYDKSFTNFKEEFYQVHKRFRFRPRLTTFWLWFLINCRCDSVPDCADGSGNHFVGEVRQGAEQLIGIVKKWSKTSLYANIILIIYRWNPWNLPRLVQFNLTQFISFT